MAYTDNFPQRPVFMADFANGGRIDPRATFSRASTANVWDGSKHLSSENLVVQSQDLDTTWNVFTGTPAVTGGQAAPDETSTGWLITAQTASSAISQAQQSLSSVGASTTYTLSAYLKAGTASHTYMTLRGTGSTYGFVEIDWADPLNPRVATRTFTSASATVTAVGSAGWYRVALTTTTDASSSSGVVYIGPSDGTTQNANGYPVWNSSGETALVWGVQLEERSSATAYNATTTQIHREYAPSLVSKANNVGRFDYSTDGQSMGTSLGILIEGSATNLVTYSEDFSNAFWTKTRLSVDSNVATAPDGTLAASALRVDGTAANTHRMRFTYATGGATAQTFSIFAKAGSKSWLALKFDSSGGAFDSSIAYFNLASGTTGTVDSGVTAKISACGNGWYRCSITRTALASATGLIELYVGEADNDYIFDGNSYDYILAWGAQVEANASHPSSLISTSGASATRAAESLSMTDSSLFDNGGGTLYAEASHNVLDEYNGVFAVSDGTGANTIEILNDTSRFRGQVVNANSTNAIFMDGTITAGQFNKHALTFSSSEASYYVNGSQIGTTDSSVVVPAVSEIDIGDVAWGRPLNGHIRKVALYSEPISETAAAALTS